MSVLELTPFTFIYSNYFVFWSKYWTKKAWALFLTNNWDLIQREKIFKCSACAASFAKKDTVHIAIVLHEERKYFKSNVCDDNFSLRSVLKSSWKKTELRHYSIK